MNRMIIDGEQELTKKTNSIVRNSMKFHDINPEISYDAS